MTKSDSVQKSRLYPLGPIPAIVALLVLVCAATAATNYVAPNGTPQGDGTREKPFDIHTVIEKAALKPGDEVVLLDGVYGVSRDRYGKGAVSLTAQGAPGQPIVYRAEHAHQAIFDAGVPLGEFRPSVAEKGAFEAVSCFGPSA